MEYFPAFFSFRPASRYVSDLFHRITLRKRSHGFQLRGPRSCVRDFPGNYQRDPVLFKPVTTRDFNPQWEQEPGVQERGYAGLAAAGAQNISAKHYPDAVL
jgi:hypothetical protein